MIRPRKDENSSEELRSGNPAEGIAQLGQYHSINLLKILGKTDPTISCSTGRSSNITSTYMRED
jgi:hypothetical protein